MLTEKSLQVKSIGIGEVKKILKTCPKEVIDYVKALENCLERQKDLTNKAIFKIRELSKNSGKIEIYEDEENIGSQR